MRGLMAALFLGLCAAAAAAETSPDAVGSISYMEGTVSMVRDGSDVDNVAIGQDLQNFDLVKTGADGQAELSINAPRLPVMTIKMTTNTQFSLEVATVNGQLESTVGVIGGQVALKWPGSSPPRPSA